MASDPKITVLLCTVRPDAAYLDHPEWHVIGKVVEDLSKQTFQDFELVIVDKVPRTEMNGDLTPEGKMPAGHGCMLGLFDRKRIPPRENLWTRNKKVAICTYRNIGLTHARGELVVNIDDCCVLPPRFLEAYWALWERKKQCLAMLWPPEDQRPAGVVGQHFEQGEIRPLPRVYGFGSYPLEAALQLNGYDEAYDGAQGLEDNDWSIRLFHAGVKQKLFHIPGFALPRQSAHHPAVINRELPIVKCCNRAWNTQRVARHVIKANVPELWTKEWLDGLVGAPCPLLKDGMCYHHGFNHACAYPEQATKGYELARQQYDEPPVFDLVAERKKVHG